MEYIYSVLIIWIGSDQSKTKNIKNIKYLISHLTNMANHSTSKLPR